MTVMRTVRAIDHIGPRGGKYYKWVQEAVPCPKCGRTDTYFESARDSAGSILWWEWCTACGYEQSGEQDPPGSRRDWDD